MLKVLRFVVVVAALAMPGQSLVARQAGSDLVQRALAKEWAEGQSAEAIKIAVVLLGAGSPAQSGNDLFQKALAKERAEGQLDAAIQLYEQIVREFAADRPLAAKALLQIGRCYERLGKDAAQKAYDRLVRDYGDQRTVADEARARLAALSGTGPAGRRDAIARQRAGGMSSRHVWTLPGSGTITGVVSHDGRYVPYTDWGVPGGSGELFFHDTTSGANRRMTNDVEQFGQQFIENGGTFSPDDAEFAYCFFNKDHFELRIVGVRPSAGSHPRVLFSNPEVAQIWPDDWSRDGRWLAVQLKRKDKTAQIGLVAVQDGSLRVLKSVDWRGSFKLFFSPDSKYLAYDLPTADAGGQRDVFILAIDGSREIAAVAHPGNDVVVGWSPDGRHLLFTSDRTGSKGLWTLGFGDGKPHGAPQQIKDDVAGASMGVTSQGTLYSFINHPRFGLTRSDIHVAAFDFATGQFVSTPAVAVHAFVGANNFPAWSPDGKSLAYLSRRGEMAEGSLITVIGILSEDTGRVRELRPQLDIYVGGAGLRWSPDGRSLAIQATDAKGRQGVFRIDAVTGEATPIALSSREPGGLGESFTGPMWAPDGKSIYYSRVNRADGLTTIVERDLSSGNEREVIRRRGRPASPADLSRDGKYLAGMGGDYFAGAPSLPGRTRKWNVWLVPVGGGAPTELMRGESHGAGVLMWTPDNRSIFVYSIKDKATGDREVWRVPTDGTEPRKFDLDVNFLGPIPASDQQFQAHPDGRRVAFAASEPAKPWEVWALENFLPAVPVRAPALPRR
jgi:Tol biopolymer transport system component